MDLLSSETEADAMLRSMVIDIHERASLASRREVEEMISPARSTHVGQTLNQVGGQEREQQSNS